MYARLAIEVDQTELDLPTSLGLLNRGKITCFLQRMSDVLGELRSDDHDRSLLGVGAILDADYEV